MSRRLLPTLVVLGALIAPGCRSTTTASPAVAAGSAPAPSVAPGENERARRLVCADIGESSCLAECSDDASPREHAECLLRYRFASDPAAFELARALYAETSVLVGVDARGAIDGYRGDANVEMAAALPVGDDRHHLVWLREGLLAIDAVVGALSARTSEPVTFDARPRAVTFFRTGASSYPSAFVAEGGVISYNLDGPLNGNARDMRETLIHELFHLNDGIRGEWSEGALGGIFASIVERCGEEHECLAPFAPHESTVPDGTFYAFDSRTRDVREYGAELGLRYFIEQETILAGRSLDGLPFKCLTDENRVAWRRLADSFFGGADVTPACDAP